MSRESALAQTFVELADSLVDTFDVVELLTVLTDSCVDLLDVAACGIMLADLAGQLRVVASSSEAMRLLELFELQADEGPCLDAYRTGERVAVPDLEGPGAARWPAFAAEASNAGFCAVHALPMRLRGSVIGALNLFRAAPGTSSDEDLDVAQAFGDVATIAILQHRATSEARQLNEQLAHALNSRIVLEQAKGMVAQHLGLDMDRSFVALRTHARNHGRKLVDVAAAVIAGELVPSALEPPAG
jgi:GAF domain-containing protein